MIPAARLSDTVASLMLRCAGGTFSFDLFVAAPGHRLDNTRVDGGNEIDRRVEVLLRNA